MTLILVIIAVIAGVFIAVTVRRVRRMECYRDATTGQTWEPRFLMVSFGGPAHRGPDGKLWHGASEDNISEDEKGRAIWWGHILLTAEAYGIPVQEITGAKHGCNWSRGYDLKGVPKHRREVMYAISSMLVEQCREGGVPGCAWIIGEYDARPFGVNDVGQFFKAAFDLKIMDVVFLHLAHANIPDLANRETVLHRLLRRRITPDELLVGMRYMVGEKIAA